MGEAGVCVELVIGGENSSVIGLREQVKEAAAANEDLKSEVSNPITSPKENAFSCQDISSQQPTELVRTDQVRSGEATSTCSRNSSSEETLSEETEPSSENNAASPAAFQGGTSRNDASASVSTTHVILEAPKHASSTSGIRKITFKFSKRDEDYAPVARTVIDWTDHYNEEKAGNYSWVDSGECREIYSCAPNMELKMSKKVFPNYPSNVKKLLSTGILDGARVKYITFSPARELEGVIDGGGYLCGCSVCNFTKVLSAYEFELHAGVKTRHPNNHIYLENGKPIYSIIQELKTAPISMLDEVLKDVAGSSINEQFFEDWKASLQQSNGRVGADRKFCSKLPKLPHPPASGPGQNLEENFYANISSFMHSKPVREQFYMENIKEKKCALKRPGSYISSSVLKQKKTAEGGTKKRDNDLHRLLFMPNGLPDGAELSYYVKGQKILGGYKQGNGIVCSCCDRVISPSQFEAHAGMAARRQPYRHICTSNGLTLHDIAISLANGQSLTTGISDDMCAKCGDAGDLILCESCPQAFHPACLDLQCVPEGIWHCPNCNNLGQGENFSRPIVIRLSRVVKTPEDDCGCCVVCRGDDFSTGGFDDRTVILCDQCEKEFHVGCLQNSGICDLKEIPRDKWFCCVECNRIHVVLQNSVSSGLQMISASQFNIIKRKHDEKGLFIDKAADDVQWRILMGKSRDQEHLLLLSGAAAIFRECFDPIVAKTGRDLIPVMVYGRNISGQEFGGMYCALLIVKGVVVSAGLVRVFGREVAELPLVATGRAYQGKGYFQALFSCIESLLCSLNVETLVIPAAEEAESIWIKRFGFRKMNGGRLSEYTRELQLTIFKGTSMLEKEVPRTIA